MNQFLKEWNEACVYADECLPPFLYSADWDLIGFMGFTALVAFIIWYVAERG